MIASRKPRGFALVVTLSLMGLLTVVAVGLLTLSTISLRSSSQGAAMSVARANARLALMLALGDLQKELGPDQRISAPGGQQFAEGDKSAGNQWIGVYDAWPAGDEKRPSPKFRRWLISGDDSVLTNPTAAKSSASSANKVPLVAADADHLAVEAGLIKTPTGNCAWWVGDQNMKAKLGGAVEPAVDNVGASARLQSAPRAAHEFFFGDTAVAADAPELDRLASGRTAELLGKPVKPLFHDATADSLGLLTNVRAGGFRKDLNFLMETPMPKPNSPEVAPLYTAGSTPGINLGELWVDHNIWAELEFPANPPKHADGGTIPSGIPFLVTKDSKTDPFIIYKHLPRLQLTLLYSLISKSRMANGKKVYDLSLVADPVFTIWNPFDACLQVPASAFATFKSWAIPYDLKMNLTGGPAGSKTSYSKSIKELSNNRLFFFYGQLGREQNLVMRPGEVQVIAQGFGESIKNPGKGAWQFDGKLGWEFASGYAYPIPYETNPALMNGSQRITYSMTPNTGKSDAGMFLWSYNIGELVDGAGTTNYVGGFNIDLIYSRLAGESPISASNFPKIFPPLPLDPSAAKTIAELEGNKWPICVFTYGLRTESDPMFEGEGNPGTRFTGRAMLRANETSVSQDLYNLDPDIVRTSPLQVGMRRVNSLNSPIIECDANGLGYYGAEYGASGGVSHVITRSIPRVPIHSLGALQHGAAEGTRFGQSRGERSWFMQPSISHAISNSFAPSCFAPSEVRGTLAKRDAADHSYLANLALWDNYFYSSITPRTTSAHRDENAAYREQKKRLESFLTTDSATHQPLPNERMRAWTPDAAATLRSIFPSIKPVSDAADRTGSFLMVDGMFNVNSTSVAAWRSFLSGLKGTKVPVSPTPALKKEADLVNTSETPVAALLAPGAGEIDDARLSDPADNDQWLGFRSLDDGQIEELAKAIVKQVRLRGPFLSIADFINRRPDNDKDLALSGALQSALDDKDVSINQAYRDGERALSTTDAAAQGFPFPEAEAGAKAVGAPGYVKQGDLLTPLGPLINVRGDTFVIRGYGESRDATGTKVLARSWCEAVVQRVPDFVDPSDASYNAVPKSKSNLTFGRRFNIVSFRHLASGEVL
ncbi:MAG: pilus assembly PilX N-terminal domain-containing protein [Akkermansiaceae bacterium]